MKYDNTTDTKVIEREHNLRLAHSYLSLAAKHLYIAESNDEMLATHCFMDIVQMDHAELIENFFPVVSKK